MATHPRTPISIDERAQAIRLRIVTGDIPLGPWLRQEKLAEQFGVSRTPVRKPSASCRAPAWSSSCRIAAHSCAARTAKDVEEAYVVRAELEGLAAELAATRITPSELRQLREAETLFADAVRSFAAMTPAGQAAGREAQREWSYANDRFDLTVQHAADNERLLRLTADLHNAFPRSLTSRPLLEHPALLDENVQQHRAIREALESGDPAASRSAMRVHVQRAGELVSEWFAEHRESIPGSA